MLKKTLSLTMLILVGLFSFGVVAAQDVTPEATPDTSLETVTADTGSFVGQEVTLTGNIEEFVNPRTFVLGEGAALDDDKVLVINNSDYEWYVWIHKGLDVTVTGMVYPAINEGGLDQLISSSPAMMPTSEGDAPGLTEATLESNEAVMPDMSATEDMSMMPTDEKMTPMGDMSATEDTSLITPVPTEDMMLMPTEEALLPTVEVNPTDNMAMMPTLEGTEDMSMATPMPTEEANLLATLTPEPATTRPDFSTMNLPDEYLDYTIIVVSSVDAVVYNPPAQ